LDPRPLVDDQGALAPSQRHGVLADAAGEDEAVPSVQGGLAASGMNVRVMASDEEAVMDRQARELLAGERYPR
jgi:hypothetical protein